MSDKKENQKNQEKKLKKDNSVIEDKNQPNWKTERQRDIAAVVKVHADSKYK
jgi:hypothetical protein